MRGGGVVEDTLAAYNADMARRVAPYGNFQGYQRAQEREQRSLYAQPARGESRRADGEGGGARVVNVTRSSPTINLGDINISASGRAADDPKVLAAMVGEHVQKAIRAALEDGSDRRLINAVREAAR